MHGRSREGGVVVVVVVVAGSGIPEVEALLNGIYLPRVVDWGGGGVLMYCLP